MSRYRSILRFSNKKCETFIHSFSPFVQEKAIKAFVFENRKNKQQTQTIVRK